MFDTAKNPISLNFYYRFDPDIQNARNRTNTENICTYTTFAAREPVAQSLNHPDNQQTLVWLVQKHNEEKDQPAAENHGSYESLLISEHHGIFEKSELKEQLFTFREKIESLNTSLSGRVGEPTPSELAESQKSCLNTVIKTLDKIEKHLPQVYSAYKNLIYNYELLRFFTNNDPALLEHEPERLVVDGAKAKSVLEGVRETVLPKCLTFITDHQDSIKLSNVSKELVELSSPTDEARG